MSIQTLPRGRQLATDVRPVVQPSRRRLDWRFPSVAFTITTDLPWVEVLVASDPSLFDPAKAADRTQATFYASRSDGGLTPTVGGRARYVAPAAVVERLAAGGSIWYVALAYADASGTGGISSAASGASGVVTVEGSDRVSDRVNRRHRSLALTRALTDASADDRRAGEDGADIAPRPMGGLGYGRGGGTLGARDRVRSLGRDDRLDGEDGADLAATTMPARPPAAAVRRPGPTSPPPAASPAPAAPLLPDASPAPATPLPPTFRAGGVDEPVEDRQPTATLSLEEYADKWDDVDPRAVPALGTSPALDEYPDILWGDVPGSDPDLPAYLSLEGDDHDARRATPGASAGPGGVAVGTAQPARLALPSLDLAPETQRRIIEVVAGSDGAAYSAVNADGPYRGRHGPGHKAFQRYHTGLAFGIAEFAQDSGTLGQLLTLMHKRDPDTFASIFGPASDALLAVTTAPGPSGEHVEGGRGPRVQPVDGFDLWDTPWTTRFRAAGEVPAFRAAQNQLAAELFLAPLLPVAAGFGLVSERALAMVLDRAFVLGEQGAKRWLADTVGPARTPAQRHDALAALGYATVEAFQAAVPGLLTDGEFGPMTQATLAAALRELGPSSPLPLLDLQQAVAAMVRRAQGEEGSARLVRLASAPDVGDGPVGG